MLLRFFCFVLFYFVLFCFVLAAPKAYGSSQIRDQIQAAAVTYTTARSLTYCPRLGTKPVLSQRQAWILNLLCHSAQWELLLLHFFCCFYLFLFFKNQFYWSTVAQKAVLVLGVQQSKSDICTYTHTHTYTHKYVPFQNFFPYRLLNSVEYIALHYIVGPCYLFYVQLCVYRNLNPSIYPSFPIFPLW